MAINRASRVFANDYGVLTSNSSNLEVDELVVYYYDNRKHHNNIEYERFRLAHEVLWLGQHPTEIQV